MVRKTARGLQEMKKIQLFFAVSTMLPLMSSCASMARSGGLFRTTLCELVASDSNSDGSRVRISAIFQTDGIESSVLSDPACPGSSMALSSENAPGADEESIDSFDQLISSNPLSGSGYRKVKLDVTGVLSRRTDGMPSVVLHMEKVWSAKRLE
jgi:hypothetical protein